MISEDLCQMRAGYTLGQFAKRVDCEDFAQDNISNALSIMKLKLDLGSCLRDAPLDEVMPPELYPGMSTAQRIELVQAKNHLLQQVDDVKCVFAFIFSQASFEYLTRKS